MEIVKGLKVYLKPNGNLKYRGIQEGTVSEVGRKYFYIGLLKFDIRTLKNISEDCTSTWTVYETKQAILDEEEKTKLLHKFADLFFGSKKVNELTLDQLREMSQIANLE